jgi:hypothetical protein
MLRFGLTHLRSGPSAWQDHSAAMSISTNPSFRIVSARRSSSVTTGSDTGRRSLVTASTPGAPARTRGGSQLNSARGGSPRRSGLTPSRSSRDSLPPCASSAQRVTGSSRAAGRPRSTMSTGEPALRLSIRALRLFLALRLTAAIDSRAAARGRPSRLNSAPLTTIAGWCVPRNAPPAPAVPRSASTGCTSRSGRCATGCRS